ncbi:MAG: hypothetical protein ACNA8W_13320 [Bradymonadaceae bacterium]
MFRLKIALAFVLLLSAYVLFVYVSLQTQLAPALQEDAEIALKRTAAIAEKSRRLDEFALLEKAKFVARRGDLHNAMTAEHETEAKYERHMEVHRRLLRDEIYFTEFLPRGKEDTRNIDLDLLNRRPLNHDLFIALDETGEGVAALGKDLLDWYGDNVAREYSVILDVIEKKEARTDVWLWSWNANQDKQLYAVAIAPIIPRDSDQAVGVVVIGSVISDGVARRSQALLAGHTKADGPGAGQARERSLVPEIVFFKNNRIYGSTFGTQAQQRLSTILFEEQKVHEENQPEKLLHLELDQKPYTALVRFFTDQYATDAPSGFVVLTDSAIAREPVAKAQKNILFVGALVLFFGLMLLMLFIYQFIKPFDRLEQGVQEIIAGNKAYEFSSDGLHEHAASFASQLGLMSAYLQGKPMPDDDGAEEGWGELMPGDDGAAKKQAGAPKIEGVMLPGMSPAPKEEATTDEEIT